MPLNRRLQFSIKSLLILVGGLCIWLGVAANAARTQREVVNSIKAVGGVVRYDWQITDDQQDSGRKHPPGPLWLRLWLGDEYFQSVVAVYFDETLLHDDQIPPIERLGTIRFLSLGDTLITDATVSRITHLQNLSFLNIGATNVTDASMHDVAQLKRLETLWAGNWRYMPPKTVGDDGICHLCTLPRLSELQVEGSGITDLSIETLKTIPTLRKVHFSSTAVSEQGREELKRALPACEVDWGVY